MSGPWAPPHRDAPEPRREHYELRVMVTALSLYVISLGLVFIALVLVTQ